MRYMWPAGSVCLRCISYGLSCGFGPRVAEIQAQLTAAEFNLEETVVRAPTDGYVTQLALRPGMMAVPLPLRPVMVLVQDEERYFFAAFRQNSVQRLKAGYQAEFLFRCPCRSLWLTHKQTTLPQQEY